MDKIEQAQVGDNTFIFTVRRSGVSNPRDAVKVLAEVYAIRIQEDQPVEVSHEAE